MPTEPQDLVTDARELLETHSIVAMRVDKRYKEIRPLISRLCEDARGPETLRTGISAQDQQRHEHSRLRGNGP